MTADPLAALLLPVILAIGVARLRGDGPAFAARMLRVELALTVPVLLAALLSSAPGQRRAALLAAILATASLAGVLPRLLGDATRPDPTRAASRLGTGPDRDRRLTDRTPTRTASRGLVAVAAGLLLIGWTFAAIHAESELIPSGIARREIALAVAVFVVAVLGFLLPARDPATVLCRLASLGNAVLLLASVIPGSPAPAIVASLCLVPVTLLAAVLLPRLLIAQEARRDDPSPP